MCNHNLGGIWLKSKDFDLNILFTATSATPVTISVIMNCYETI